MKKLSSYLIASIVMMLAFTGCSKNDSEPAPTYAAGQGNITGTGGLTFNVSGTSTAFTRQVTYGIDVVAMVGIGIGGSTSKIVTLGFANISTAGTYPFTVGNGSSSSQVAIMSYTPDTNTNTEYSTEYTTVSAGSITITAISATTIKGTYTAKLTNLSGATISVSGTFEGKF